ncbi:hypothetical protein [Nocardiopsis potens]|uniref:hypothetical protein n=1 Tax=Nocardiopsis potens TaxID=1246458 RepID=UPI000593D4AA|nr:hypothetical protein [Nocardiopsis potens]
MQTVTLAERPDLAAALDRPDLNPGPEFVRHDDVAERLWDRLETRFPEYQVMLLDEGRVVARGASVPLCWQEPDVDLPDEGFDWALSQAVDDHDAGRAPTVAASLLIAVVPDRRRQGLSTAVAGALRENAAARGLSALIAPLRPTLKHRYPLIPMGTYAGWAQGGGEAPFDPWLRVHWKAGARILHTCERSRTVTGTLAEWEEWARMDLLSSGEYVIPGGLSPLALDRLSGTGHYVEANVWARHDIGPGAGTQASDFR